MLTLVLLQITNFRTQEMTLISIHTQTNRTQYSILHYSYLKADITCQMQSHNNIIRNYHDDTMKKEGLLDQSMIIGMVMLEYADTAV